MVEKGLRLALLGTILLACLGAGLVFRYDTQVWGTSVLVHDRWFGTVERCDAVSGRCRPVLAAGMQPVQRIALDTPTPSPEPNPATVPHKMSDEEFNALMDRADELFGKPPQGGQ
ncbi:MAG: hypothetical protein E5X74_21500 [Mesorhizobium sp.]|uniref:hypothetical protein n=1 Tax=Mesorhizobium sp. TaxID=1871066 RepID=UPI0012168893|nr:hypothetical protein [Mesorhizobium sp.]TIO76165.1 MAG: hypothetical protein E5X75_15715 [Mesorhizobium sp.]TIO83119.1 MAG: hypothetical protein E5X74_21500 [Mesorhizobium sp.]